MESTGETKFGSAFGRTELVVGRKRSAFTQLPRRRLHTNTNFHAGSEVNVQHLLIYLGHLLISPWKFIFFHCLTSSYFNAVTLFSNSCKKKKKKNPRGHFKNGNQLYYPFLFLFSLTNTNEST